MPFSDQVQDIKYFSQTPANVFYDLLRIEGNQGTSTKLHKAHWRIPLRESIRARDHFYKNSLDNLFQMGPNKFNPELNTQRHETDLIVKRNKEMIQKIMILAIKAQSLFEVKKQDCDYIGADEYCVESKVWKANKKAAI